MGCSGLLRMDAEDSAFQKIVSKKIKPCATRNRDAVPGHMKLPHFSMWPMELGDAIFLPPILMDNKKEAH